MIFLNLSMFFFTVIALFFLFNWIHLIKVYFLDNSIVFRFTFFDLNKEMIKKILWLINVVSCMQTENR